MLAIGNFIELLPLLIGGLNFISNDNSMKSFLKRPQARRLRVKRSLCVFTYLVWVCVAPMCAKNRSVRGRHLTHMSSMSFSDRGKQPLWGLTTVSTVSADPPSLKLLTSASIWFATALSDVSRTTAPASEGVVGQQTVSSI